MNDIDMLWISGAQLLKVTSTCSNRDQLVLRLHSCSCRKYRDVVATAFAVCSFGQCVAPFRGNHQ